MPTYTNFEAYNAALLRFYFKFQLSILSLLRRFSLSIWSFFLNTTCLHALVLLFSWGQLLAFQSTRLKLVAPRTNTYFYPIHPKRSILGCWIIEPTLRPLTRSELHLRYPNLSFTASVTHNLGMKISVQAPPCPILLLQPVVMMKHLYLRVFSIPPLQQYPCKALALNIFLASAVI